jgi:adenosine deaminase
MNNYNSDKYASVPSWLVELPKVDLHCHLGGSLRIETILDLAEKNKVTLEAKNEEELRNEIVYKNKSNPSLADYIAGIKTCESVLTTPESFSRCAFEVAEDAAKENVKIFELRFAPTNYAHKNIKLYEIMEGTLDGLKRAREQYNIHTGLIVCGIRTDIGATKKAVELAVNYQDFGVVGFDIAGKENGYRPKLFEHIIRPVLENFLPVTTHAGEDDSVASIAEALIYLNAQRIGHGVSLLQSTKLFDYMDNVRIGVEACLTSNVDTGAVASLDTHPIRTFFQRNLRVFLNTDNRTISDTTITKEYMKLVAELGFTQADIYHLARNGVKAAFMNSQTRLPYLDAMDKFIANHPANNLTSLRF